MTAGEAAFTALDHEIKEFVRQESAVRETDDPEAVHDMRVAARRIRSALKVFAAFLPESCLVYEEDVKWIFRCLGGVRDLDIEIEHMNRYDSEVAKPILAALQDRRRKAKSKLTRALQTERYREMKEGLTSAVSKGPSARNFAASAPMAAAAPDLVEKSFRRLEKMGSKVEPDSSAAEFHEMRKQAKRFRYTIDFFADMYGAPAKDLIAHLKKLQDMLGARQDDVMVLSTLREISKTAKLPAPAKKLARSICQDAKGEISDLAADFPDLFDPIRKEHWRKLRADMRKSRRDLWNRG